jgi:hypothetical protein
VIIFPGKVPWIPISLGFLQLTLTYARNFIFFFLSTWEETEVTMGWPSAFRVVSKCGWKGKLLFKQ